MDYFVGAFPILQLQHCRTIHFHCMEKSSLDSLFAIKNTSYLFLAPKVQLEHYLCHNFDKEHNGDHQWRITPEIQTCDLLVLRPDLSLTNSFSKRTGK